MPDPKRGPQFRGANPRAKRGVTMLVQSAMTEGVQCARPTDTIARAAQRMRDLNIGALPVCGEDNELLGMLTDRDIVIRAVADCCDPDSKLVGDVMSPGITFCYDDYDVEDAAHVMENKQ